MIAGEQEPGVAGGRSRDIEEGDDPQRRPHPLGEGPGLGGEAEPVGGGEVGLGIVGVGQKVAGDEDRHENNRRQDPSPSHRRDLNTATAAASPATTIEPK